MSREAAPEKPMHFRQFYVGCLAHASYLIGDGGEAVVVDPSRDVERYLEEAKAHGLRITWVLETHLHADFVSGHRDLAELTGAQIGIGAGAEARFAHTGLRDGDDVCFGGARLGVMATPGHTPESLSFLLYERAKDPQPTAVFTGDTLFVGDVGRVDILSSRLPVQDLAARMYDSLQKLMKLPDETRVYPAHGAGSLCGRSISSDSWSTIGRERTTNPALRPMSREAFVAEVTRDVPETPVYYLHSRDLNRDGPRTVSERPMPPALAPAEAAARVQAGAVLLDTRPAAAYGAAHPAGALHVPLDGQFASWVGTLVRPDDRIVLLADPEREEEAVVRLARVGYENVAGFVAGGIAAWSAAGLPTAATPQVAAPEALASGRHVLDVRRAREWDDFHAPGAVHLPLAELPVRFSELDKGAEWSVVCASGYRSTIATSVLERAGFRHVINAVGGMAAARQAAAQRTS